MKTFENDFEINFEMRPTFTDELMNSIVEHDNKAVRSFLETNKTMIELMKDSLYTNPPALSTSVEADNLQATCLLLEHGWEDGNNTALSDTMIKNDYSRARFLLSLGFQQTCYDCYECGWPNTCTLVNTMTSYDESSVTCRNDLEFWCRSHDEEDVIHSFSRYLVNEKFDERIASRILDVVINTGNLTTPCTFPLTDVNSGFITSLCERGLVDVTRQAHRTVVDILECIYTINNTPSKKASFSFKMLKTLIDMGACVDTRLEVEETYMLPLVLPGLDLTQGLSVRDVVEGFGVEDRDVKRVKRTYSRQPHIKKVAEYMKLSSEYIRFKSRSGFIAKRIRGFDEWEEPGYLASKLVEMPPEVFGRVMMYVI